MTVVSRESYRRHLIVTDQMQKNPAARAAASPVGSVYQRS